MKRKLSTLQKWAIAFVVAGVMLCVVGFCLPPVGDIPKSDIEFFGEILVAVGLFMGWDTIKDAINKGTDATVKIGDKVEVHLDNDGDGNGDSIAG